jgi:glycosyltransferase involved in cell wall biosynthesis
MKKTILFLSEFPLTNGVIQAQLLPIMITSARSGYDVHVIETMGRFEAQEKDRNKLEKDLNRYGIKAKKIKVPRHTFLPSIIYFNLQSFRIIRQNHIKDRNKKLVVYARNYKFLPLLLLVNLIWKIPFIYSPRGAYVAERKFYGHLKEKAYAFFIKFLEKRAIQRSHKTIVETDSFKKHLIHLYGLNNQKNIVVMPNYYDESLLPGRDWDRNAMRHKLGFTEKKVVVYAGTLEVWYDFSKMFKLVSNLKKKNPDIFFQLFLKEDYARDESYGMLEKIDNYANKYGLKRKKDYNISSYPPSERYLYLSACDIGICLTTPHEFKTIMLYLKILDYWGSKLPVIINNDVTEVKKIIQKTSAGAIVDYANWEKSVSSIEMEKLCNSSLINWNEIRNYSSENVVSRYLDLFQKILNK